MNQPDTALEAERRRLAQLLDSDIISGLELLQAQTSTYLDALRANPQAQLSLSVLQSLIQQTIQKARYVQANLHPTVLETLGLEPALETLAADAKRVRGLTLHLTIPRLRERLPAEVEVTLFRGVQLLLDVAVEQAHATRFELHLTHVDQIITLNYTDNGAWSSSFLRMLHPLQTALPTVSGTMDLRLTAEGQLRASLQVQLRSSMSLTPREAEILQRAAEGLTNKEIASALHLSARTVNFHLDNIYSKLNVSTRTEAAMLALQQGWIKNPVK